MSQGQFFLLGGAIFWGIVCGLAGENWRGRGTAGGIAGLLLGPLGLLVIAIMQDARARCPACSGILPDKKATICMHCRSSLVPGKKPSPVALEPWPQQDDLP